MIWLVVTTQEQEINGQYGCEICRGLYLCLWVSDVTSKELWALRGWESSSEWSPEGTPLEDRWLALMLADLVWPRVGLVPSLKLYIKLINNRASILFFSIISTFHFTFSLQFIPPIYSFYLFQSTLFNIYNNFVWLNLSEFRMNI